MYIYGMPCKASKGIYKGGVKMFFFDISPPPPQKKKKIIERLEAFLFRKKKSGFGMRGWKREVSYTGFRFKNNMGRFTWLNRMSVDHWKHRVQDRFRGLDTAVIHDDT